MSAAVAGRDVDPLAARVVAAELDPAAVEKATAEGQKMVQSLADKLGHLFDARNSEPDTPALVLVASRNLPKLPGPRAPLQGSHHRPKRGCPRLRCTRQCDPRVLSPLPSGPCSER